MRSIGILAAGFFFPLVAAVPPDFGPGAVIAASVYKSGSLKAPAEFLNAILDGAHGLFFKFLIFLFWLRCVCRHDMFAVFVRTGEGATKVYRCFV